MTRLAKQLPWDHPIARTLNHEVHRRKMAGKSCRFFHWQDSVPSFTHTLFFGGGVGGFVVVFPDLDFLWPIHLCPRLNWAACFWVPDCSCWFFCLRFLRFPGRQTCLSYLSVDSAPYPRLRMQSLWSMVDGYTLNDLIFRRDCSLTEDEVMAYVRRTDPTYQKWNDWPLRVTFRVNFFLRANGASPEPDLDILNSF